MVGSEVTLRPPTQQGTQSDRLDSHLEELSLHIWMLGSEFVEVAQFWYYHDPPRGLTIQDS